MGCTFRIMDSTGRAGQTSAGITKGLVPRVFTNLYVPSHQNMHTTRMHACYARPGTCKGEIIGIILKKTERNYKTVLRHDFKISQ